MRPHPPRTGRWEHWRVGRTRGSMTDTEYVVFVFAVAIGPQQVGYDIGAGTFGVGDDVGRGGSIDQGSRTAELGLLARLADDSSTGVRATVHEGLQLLLGADSWESLGGPPPPLGKLVA